LSYLQEEEITRPALDLGGSFNHWIGLTENYDWNPLYSVGGIPTPLEKYAFVSWDDDIPNRWKFKKNHVPNHQPVIFCWDQTMVFGDCPIL
jgi:hypothetical protein